MPSEQLYNPVRICDDCFSLRQREEQQTNNRPDEQQNNIKTEESQNGATDEEAVDALAAQMEQENILN